MYPFPHIHTHSYIHTLTSIPLTHLHTLILTIYSLTRSHSPFTPTHTLMYSHSHTCSFTLPNAHMCTPTHSNSHQQTHTHAHTHTLTPLLPQAGVLSLCTAPGAQEGPQRPSFESGKEASVSGDVTPSALYLGPSSGFPFIWSQRRNRVEIAERALGSGTAQPPTVQTLPHLCAPRPPLHGRAQTAASPLLVQALRAQVGHVPPGAVTVLVCGQCHSAENSSGLGVPWGGLCPKD